MATIGNIEIRNEEFEDLENILNENGLNIEAEKEYQIQNIGNFALYIKEGEANGYSVLLPYQVCLIKKETFNFYVKIKNSNFSTIINILGI